MLRRVSPLIFLATTTMYGFASSIALAAEEHGVHEEVGAIPTLKQGLGTLITGLIVFAVVFAVMSAKVWPTISKALGERADKIRKSVEEAERAQQQAKAALAQYEKNLADARAKAQKMLDDAVAQQQAVASDLKAKADVELAEMRDRARKDIESAKQAALAEISTQSTALAASMASKILKREISVRDAVLAT